MIRKGFAHPTLYGQRVSSEGPVNTLREMQLRANSVRAVSYLTGLPKSTVHDHAVAQAKAKFTPSPFWQAVDF